MLRAFHKDTDVEVQLGEELKDFRGETWYYTGCGSSRLVYVAPSLDEMLAYREFFPSAFNLVLKETDNAA